MEVDDEVGATSVSKSTESKKLTLHIVGYEGVYEFTIGRKEAAGLRDQLVAQLVGERETEEPIGTIVAD